MCMYIGKTAAGFNRQAQHLSVYEKLANGQELSLFFRPAICFGVSPASESPPPFVLVFPGLRKVRRRLFWCFPGLGILQIFCFDVFPASEFYKCFVLTFSKPRNFTNVLF